MKLFIYYICYIIKNKIEKFFIVVIVTIFIKWIFINKESLIILINDLLLLILNKIKIINLRKNNIIYYYFLLI